MGRGCLPPAKSKYSTQEKSFHQNAGSAHLDGPQLGRPLSWEIRLPVGASAGAPPTRPSIDYFCLYRVNSHLAAPAFLRQRTFPGSWVLFCLLTWQPEHRELMGPGISPRQ